MARNRDDFNKRTRNDLALRASYLCSLCKCSTVGPSDEGKNAVTMTGVAAHICAAAPGPELVVTIQICPLKSALISTMEYGSVCRVVS